MHSRQFQTRIGPLLAALVLGALLVGSVLTMATAASLAPQEGTTRQPASLTPPSVTDMLQEATPQADTLGTCYTFQETSGQLLPPLAAAAGSRWDRFDFRWNVIEGEDERLPVLNFGPHDEVVNRDRLYGFNIIGILGSTPKWAAPTCHVLSSLSQQNTLPEEAPLFPQRLLQADDAYWWRPCPPQGLDLPWDHPDNVWGNYVYQTVSHFRGRVTAWEIWNEPDLGQTFWSGSVRQYAQLLKIGYQAAKAADPNVTVLFAGLAYWSNPSYYVAVLDALRTLDGAAANNYYFDVMSLHLYSSVYQIRPIAAEIQANMASRVGPHPIWLTETGVPLWDEWPAGTPVELRINRATASEAANYVVQAFAEARAIGIEKFVFFRTHDDYMSVGWLPEYFGLIRNDLTARPAYAAFQVAAGYLQSENQVTGPFSHGGVRRITFWGTPRGRVDVLWNEIGTPLVHTHTAYLPTATVVDIEGNTTAVTASDGYFTLTLPAATANTAADGGYLIGGAPLLLVQEDTSPPATSLRALPAVLYTDTVTLTWDATDQGTGYWYSEIEGSTAPGGPWEPLLGWGETQGITETQLMMTAGGTHYFRARARDYAGNWEAWPDAAEISTTLILTRTVTLSVTAFLDTNSNNQWDAAEPASGEAELVWQSLSGLPITATVGTRLHATAVVTAGDFRVRARHPEYVSAEAIFRVRAGPEPLQISFLLGLKEIRGRVYLPLIAR